MVSATVADNIPPDLAATLAVLPGGEITPVFTFVDFGNRNGKGVSPNVVVRQQEESAPIQEAVLVWKYIRVKSTSTKILPVFGITEPSAADAG
jgi:hypothetical protein